MKRILIADDVPGNIYLLRVLLEGHGYLVDEASNGAEALTKARLNPPQLLISDLLMPLMDGYTLLRRWKADPQLMAIPFVVYTATYTGPSDEKLAIDLGADAFILKPAEPESFIRSMAQVLAKAARGELSPVRAPHADHASLLSSHSEALIRKLEHKALQLEESNRALLEDVLRRERAEAKAKRFLEQAERAHAVLSSSLESQRQVEQALMESEASLRLALDAAQMGTFVWNLSANRVMFSCPKLSDSPAVDVDSTYEGFLQWVHAADRAEVGAELQRCRSRCAPFMREFRIANLERGADWLAVRGEFELDGDRRAVRMRGVMQVVTARKRAEAALRESEASLASAQELAKVGSWALDAGARVGTWSAQMYRFFDRDPTLGPPSNSEALELVHPDDRATGIATNTLLFCHGGSASVVVRSNPERGPMKWLEGIIVARTDEFGHRRLLGTLQDVTERELAQEAVRQKTSHLENALNMAGMGVWRWDLRTDEFATLEKGGPVTGLDPAVYPKTGQAFIALLHPDDRALVEAKLESAKAGEDYDVEFRIQLARGEMRWVAARGRCERDSLGLPSVLTGLDQDITERKTLEERLRHSQKMEAIGQLAGGIAHDFNNILAAMIGNAEMARLDLPSGHSAYTSIDEILRAGQRARELIQRILTFSRPADNQLRPIQLHQVLEEAERLLRATLPAGVALVFDAAPGLPAVRADASQIHQVVLNLVTNAWHAMESRPGRIVTRLEACRVDSSLCLMHPELLPGPYVRLSVSDTGKGMDPETLERVFEPFFTTKEPGQGVGLGLAVVHGIVRGHGGVIVAESQLGRGATFCLYLPIANESADTRASAPPVTSEAHGCGELILYVDDEEPLVTLAVRFLEQIGYRVDGYTRANEALRAFRARPQSYDVVITDFNMPGMSGMELAQQLMRIRPDAPIALTSGYLRPGEIEAAQAIGIREVIPKPYLVEELAPRVQLMLAAARKPAGSTVVVTKALG